MKIMHSRRVSLAVAAGAATVGLLVTGSGTALAATGATFPNSSYGFDGNAHLIVGGGSTTLFKMAQSLATLWEDTAGCTTNNSGYHAAGTGSVSYPQAAGSEAFNQCISGAQTYSGGSSGGNFDGDTVAIATSVGSSTGIASLNGSYKGNGGTYAYEGTNADIPTTATNGNAAGFSNGYGTVDFDLSSRGPKTSGGNCNGTNPTSGKGGDELQCDTFWGIAADGVEIMAWDGAGPEFSTDKAAGSAGPGFSAQDIYNIYTCTITTWGQLPEWQSANANYQSANNTTANDPALPASTAPIVPWAMNSTSGTYGDFNNWINAQVTAANNSFVADTACARPLSSGQLPLENDVKPLLADANGNAFNVPTGYPAASGTPGQSGYVEGSPYPSGTTSYPPGLTTDANSPQNPINWLWFGSYGLLSQFPYLSGQTINGTAYSTFPVAVDAGGTSYLPSQGTIGQDTYPIERTLSVVTAKSDADCPVANSICDFTSVTGPTNGNGVADLPVNGATSGRGGAVREFVRFLCRSNSADQPTDPFTGKNLSTEITSAIKGSGFTLTPTGLKSPGSNCNVQSVG